MSDTHAPRWSRLLAAHSEATMIGDDTAVAVRDQLLVTARHADAVADAASRWVDRRHDCASLGVSLLRLRPAAKVDIAELATDLRGRRDGYRRYGVTPNHLYSAEPQWEGDPDGRPVPTTTIPAPVDGTAQRRVVVGVMDTGIDPHPWFVKRPWFSECDAHEFEGADAVDGELERDAGHGTFVTGVILQQAPAAWPRVQRVLNPAGVCDELTLLSGLAQLHRRSVDAEEPIEILNLSLGCYTFDDRPSPLVAEALFRYGRSAIVVAAAGNDGSDRPFWPAALKSCVAVGALAYAPNGAVERAGFSNFGWWVDACAPGEHVKSSFLYFHEENGTDFEGYASWDGTSFAAPHVAGAIAHLAAVRDVSAADAAELLLDPDVNLTAPDLGVVIDAANEGNRLPPAPPRQRSGDDR